MSQVSRTVFSKLSKIVSKVYVVKDYQKLPKLSKIDIKNCHQKLSSKIVIKIVIKNCHQKMSSKIVIINCHQKLSSKILVRSCLIPLIKCLNGQNCPKLSKIFQNCLNYQKLSKISNIVIMSVRSWFHIILIKCLKGHKSPGSLCNIVKALIVSLVRARDKVTY